MDLFALLDDATATPQAPRSRLYTGWAGEHRCTDPAALDATWAAAQADLAAGLHAVLLADYEWGVELQLGRPAATLRPDQPAPALRLLMFRHCARLDADAVAAWLAAQEDGSAEPGPAGVPDLQPGPDAADYGAAVQQVQDWIRAGESYQLNLTRPLQGRSFGEPLALYRRLRAHQPVPFGALLALPGDAWVLSCSPELFLRHEQGRLQARPMKGTTARRPDPAEDAAAAAWLAADIKNRAENLMIVDLLRNDLGRVARTGSVRVPRLFEVEPYRTVHQLTSTIEAERRPDVDLPELLRALFPCGSITGAPRHHTLELIERVEPTARGLYTGAIGWIDAPAAAVPPGQAALGDFCCSVAIRTLLLGPADAAGRRAARLGVGAGIVLDSEPAAEVAECHLKARFLTALDPGFTLFETLRVEADGRVTRLDAHLARLGASAAALGFSHDLAVLRAAVLAEAARLVAAVPQPHRLRLDLQHDGRHQLRSGVLAPLPPGPVRLLLAQQPLPPAERALLAHKTSLRRHYDAAIRAAEAAGAFDLLHFNAAGELTEGGRSNVFVQLDGRWCTPPLSAGLLPGVMRAALLADPALAAREQVLTRADLARAEALLVCNALRGALPAVLG